MINNQIIKQNQPNRLLQGLILISVGIHILIFLHIAGIYRISAMDYIELAMDDLSGPVSRAIPRPSQRPKQTDQPREVKKLVVMPRNVPKINPIRIDPVNSSCSSGLMEGIAVPSMSAGVNLGEGTYNIGDVLDAGAEYTTAKNYLEMVMLKIESSKQYPETAKSMQKEGRVTVSFVVTQQGRVKNVELVKGCSHEILNRAAIRAVKDAAPFPRPPWKFFKKDIPLKLNIIFETT